MFRQKHERVIDFLLRQADEYGMSRGFRTDEIQQRMRDLESQNEENKQNPTRVEVSIDNIGEAAIYASIIGNKASDKVYIYLGGGLSHAGSMKPIAYPVAALTNSKTIMLANVFNGESNIKSKGFRRNFYRYDKLHGGYSADGAFYAQVLEKLQQQQLLGDRIELVGQSAGAAGLLRTAAQLKGQNPEFFEKLRESY